jgi:hypothetical protein
MSDSSSPLKPMAEGTEMSGPKKRKRTLKERIVGNFKELLAMLLYLWILFALCTWHESIVLAFRELSRVMGKGVLGALFLRARATDRAASE